MTIYTRTGDQGQTSVIGGRVYKDDERVEAYGTIDELNSFVGLAGSCADQAKFADLKEDLQQIQQELFDCGSDLAFAKVDEKRFKVTPDMAERLESWIDRYEAENPVIEKFILPGGTELASLLHVCRTVCRRAERQAVKLSRKAEVNWEAVKYLNRLSDFFFAAARTANVRQQTPDVEYIRSGKVFRN
ncbi:cob(I)yrinic acid a,c-diamide adenosyltransferase [Paenibacillus vini]|uniref:cob(I)yrinic acid a,c-diamide adenosyltransferase n=1 Tax=Paenibacillus vini TaxID=1476024 RepID=UPI0025B6A156|nr:cob(I)yrinic acid a,c-diamide adenosyltransferase [Paenibacillus vini]MDN4069562.1 cob(I)yrinic acid a,c-diamide adenosyltransferase [Paenibacillus vini]